MGSPTRSPTLRFVTPSPTATTSPTPSCPRTVGTVGTTRPPAQEAHRYSRGHSHGFDEHLVRSCLRHRNLRQTSSGHRPLALPQPALLSSRTPHLSLDSARSRRSADVPQSPGRHFRCRSHYCEANRGQLKTSTEFV